LIALSEEDAKGMQERNDPPGDRRAKEVMGRTFNRVSRYGLKGKNLFIIRE
jgi:hypothetical protein